jgi:hypothetical protein
MGKGFGPQEDRRCSGMIAQSDGAASLRASKPLTGSRACGAVEESLVYSITYSGLAS